MKRPLLTIAECRGLLGFAPGARVGSCTSDKQGRAARFAWYVRNVRARSHDATWMAANATAAHARDMAGVRSGRLLVVARALTRALRPVDVVVLLHVTPAQRQRVRLDGHVLGRHVMRHALMVAAPSPARLPPRLARDALLHLARSCLAVLLAWVLFAALRWRGSGGIELATPQCCWVSVGAAYFR
jgi:hypothetical protein